MITIYEGGLGSGKSYDAVRRIISNLKAGRRVLSNIDGFQKEKEREHLRRYCDIDEVTFKTLLVYLQPEEVKQFWNLTKVNDLIVIDETQKYFSARNWQSKDNNDFAMWVTEHRHNGQDLLLISPKATQIDGYVRGMVQWVYSYRKLSMFGSLGAKKYIRFCFYEDDKKPLSRVVSNYERSIFNCYASYFAGSAKEVPIEENANILKHPVFIALALVIVLFGWTFSRSGIMQNGIFGNKAIDTGKLLIEQRQKEISEKSEKKPDPGALPEGNQSTNSEQKIERVAMGVIGSKTLYKDSTGKVTFE